jgi:hypothetical protein
MIELVFFLEEASARAMLEGFLPKIIPSTIKCRYVVFDGKQDLEKQMVKRMKGYLVPYARFVVLRDKDSEDCHVVKERLVAKCVEANKPNALVRIACHELESWYLGDLRAVEQGLQVGGLVRYQNIKPYNKPDDIHVPSQHLRSLASEYQKVGGSRSIGLCLDTNRNTSHSFKAFVLGIVRLTAR